MSDYRVVAGSASVGAVVKSSDCCKVWLPRASGSAHEVCESRRRMEFVFDVVFEP